MKWDKSPEYETGVDRGVFFPSSGIGVPWNGLVSVDSSVDDADSETRYVDGVKTRSRTRRGEFSGDIEAFTYPWARDPTPFSMSYRVKTDKAYHIHLVYNVLLGPVSFVSQQQETTSFRWTFTTLAKQIPMASPSAHLIVDTSKAYSWTVAAFEDLLYGNEFNDSHLPSPEEVLEIFEANSIVRITDHGDGTWSAEGPDYAVYMMDSTTFAIDWPSAVYIDSDTYTVHSL